MKDDQYFQVGDKVMLVDETPPLLGCHPDPVDDDEVDFGIIYVVAEFEEDLEYYNVISFVGQRPLFVLDGATQGWPACCFRKIEELKLCVQAAAKHRQPIEAMPKPNKALSES
jgi:hypothetical protein